jgi:hypothetical protein
MKRHARHIISLWSSPQNVEFLRERLITMYPMSRRVILGNLTNFMNNYETVIDKSIGMSDAMPGVTARDYVGIYNRKFMDYMDSFLQSGNPKAMRYAVNDGATAGNANVYAKSTHDILNQWYNDAGRTNQMRDDSSSRNDMGLDSALRQSRGRRAEIDFCDQSHIGTSQHHEQLLGNSYIQALNQDFPNYCFGTATPESDERLMSRRTFRSEGCIENGIPVYQQRLHRRYYEKAISDTMPSTEYDFQQRGFDLAPTMHRLVRRNEQRKAVSDYYDDQFKW